MSRTPIFRYLISHMTGSYQLSPDTHSSCRLRCPAQHLHCSVSPGALPYCFTLPYTALLFFYLFHTALHSTSIVLSVLLCHYAQHSYCSPFSTNCLAQHGHCLLVLLIVLSCFRHCLYCFIVPYWSRSARLPLVPIRLSLTHPRIPDSIYSSRS